MQDHSTAAPRPVRIPQRFTNMQWYLSHAGNTVQLVAFLDRHMPQDEFATLVKGCMEHFPALALSEDRKAERFAPAPPDAGEGKVWQYQIVQALSPDPTLAFTPSSDLFDRADRPAFRATCETLAPECGGTPRTRLHLRASHSLIEGADLAAVLRGRVNRRERRPISRNGLSLATRFGLNLTAPVLAMIQMAMARYEKRKPSDFGFVNAEMERADIVAAAKRLGVSKRGLLFAMALFTLAGPRPRKRALRFSYSKLPAQRIHLEDDAYLSVRIQFMAFKGPEDFATFARLLDRQLKLQNESEVLTQFLANRVLSVQRRVSAVFPGLYKGAFFGFAPYDMVLSLVPPLAPAGPFAAFRGARMFGGSYTGTVPAVIYLWDARRVSWTCWLERDQDDRLGNLAQLADMLAIRHKIWRQDSTDSQDR